MLSERKYIVYDEAGALEEEACTASAYSPEVVYRMGRIAEEVDGSASTPNAAANADLAEYTGVNFAEALATPVAANVNPALRAAGEAPIDETRALVMVHGKDARNVLQSVAAAGMKPYAPYTRDHLAASYLRFTAGKVCLGDKYSDALFSNAYAVLQAARACSASVILLADEAVALGDVDAFIAHAEAAGIPVFKTVSTESPTLGWVPCTTDNPATDDDDWCTCKHCGLTFYESSIAKSYYTCPSCGNYFRETSVQRISDLLDMGSFVEWDAHSPEPDPLRFPGYPEKIAAQREKTGFDEGVRTGEGTIAGMRCAFAVMDSTFFMGSMGHAVGEKLSRMVDRATEEGLPVVIFTASGGARMQEGLVSLMQMAKISCALERHAQAGFLYISVITDPTTGGVTASFAMQGDIILAEPHALIGFAGKRVIQDTIKQELPKGFQTAEFALQHGLIDAVVARNELRRTLAHLLAMHKPVFSEEAVVDRFGADVNACVLVNHDSVERVLATGKNTYNHVTYGRLPIVGAADSAVDLSLGLLKKIACASDAITPVTQRMKEALTGVFVGRDEDSRAGDAPTGAQEDAASLAGSAVADDDASAFDEAAPASAWESVQLARNTHRPTSSYYIERIFDGFIELHGDRVFGDDGAIVGGMAFFGSQPVMVIAQEKGTNLKERVLRNFGCPQPEGYRKSLRLMRLAEKFNQPIICLVDTQGAFCGADAEERGQGNAIADNLIAMAGLKVPVISVLLGEGGSGGALALAVSNVVGMQEHAVYSVLSPEGFASILWKDRSRAAEAAEVMKMDAVQVHEMGIVDEVISEGAAPAHVNPEQAADNVKSFIAAQLAAFSGASPDELVRQRHERFARF